MAIPLPAWTSTKFVQTPGVPATSTPYGRRNRLNTRWDSRTNWPTTFRFRRTSSTTAIYSHEHAHGFNPGRDRSGGPSPRRGAPWTSPPRTTSRNRPWPSRCSSERRPRLDRVASCSRSGSTAARRGPQCVSSHAFSRSTAFFLLFMPARKRRTRGHRPRSLCEKSEKSQIEPGHLP
jgi:hypothetical protein